MGRKRFAVQVVVLIVVTPEIADPRLLTRRDSVSIRTIGSSRRPAASASTRCINSHVLQNPDHPTDQTSPRNTHLTQPNRSNESATPAAEHPLMPAVQDAR
ncbi:hypothetical protein GCM10010198_02390 [Nocardia seriolae]|nr:hypothetical protein NSERKGN1266_22690 [Nocardia seriolae]BEK97677.1 hypothetical protein NSER024013_55830 [Nocardia seriolae]GEM22853.1 hypothetical protein NS2_10920 [Nocardia seriolae NBRC 15557]